MYALSRVALPPAEQRMLLHSVSWKEYVLLRDLFDGPGLRMTYAKGVLELMSPSPEHELWKKNIARLLELFAYVRQVDLRGYGSTTFRNEVKERGAEPDECYLVGKRLADFPEIVLEVVHTAPLLDKLDVYRAFGVNEVWVFRERTFTVHIFDPKTAQYVVYPSSRLIPDLDFAVLTRYALRDLSLDALREFEAEIRVPAKAKPRAKTRRSARTPRGRS